MGGLLAQRHDRRLPLGAWANRGFKALAISLVFCTFPVAADKALFGRSTTFEQDLRSNMTGGGTVDIVTPQDDGDATVALAERVEDTLVLDEKVLADAPPDTDEPMHLIALPPPSSLSSGQLLAAPAAERIVAVRRGDTMMDILLTLGLARADAHEAVSALAAVFDPRGLRPGQEITFTFAPGESGPLVGAWLAARADREVGLTRQPGGKFAAYRREKALSVEAIRAAGMVRTSLYEAGLATGVPAQVMVEFIRAFSFDVDFQRDIQPGDAFEILFDRFKDESGRVAKDGALQYASLLLSGRRLAVYRFNDRDGNVDYYNDRGESVRKALLKTPIDGARLTSGFGSRMHPILGYSAFHKGVDFGAASGTPIQAAGDGAVEMRGWFGGYGNYVRVRHNLEYSTAYAHMSRYATGIGEGVKVRQGQIIGYVGTTGRSTGAHLHYEILRRGAQINPMGVKFPTGRKLEGVDLLEFKHVRVNVDHLLTTTEAPLQIVALPPEPRPVD